MNNTTCGECRACCVVLPIAEPDLVKPAGEPCKHLCETGCGIYGRAEWPTLCRKYYCGWRQDKWMSQRPLYRPDTLGVIFQFTPGVLALFEVRPGALQSQQVQYIKARLRGDAQVNNYPVGVLDELRVDPATVTNGEAPLDTEKYEWEDLGGDEHILKLKMRSSRMPLPLVA